MTSASKVLTEDEVTISNLKEIFESAFLKTTLDKDGDLIVHTDNGPRVIVTVDRDRGLLKFLSIYANESGRLEAKHANRINDNYIFIRVCVPEAQPEILVIDYYLPFEGGITAYQVISALRIFARVGPAAIREEASRCITPDHLLQ